MGDQVTYEYAEMIVGFFGRGEGNRVLTFMHVRDLTGRSMNPDFDGGTLRALNVMGAQGWRVVSEREATSGAMGWVAAATQDETVQPENYVVSEFLMTREVRE